MGHTTKAGRGKPGRPAKAAGDVDLRERILDVAEAAFASRGYEAVSTREVARVVGATPAMIHYYFKSKRQLFEAVFARRADILNAERMAGLDCYQAQALEVTVEGAISAFLRPVLEKLAQGDPGWRSYLALVAQVAQVTEWGGAVMTQSFDPVIHRLIAVIRRALPGAADEDLYWAYHFLSGALVLTLAETDRIDRLSGGRCRSTDIAAIEPRMVSYAASGFRALAGARCAPQREP